jgi:sterol desaturase/sphingolipid hydroxylase (fatty acid hydroxylase superfamily)
VVFEDFIALAIPLLFVVFLAAERLIGGGRSFPEVRLWTLLGFAGLFVSGAVNAILPPLLAPSLTGLRLVDLSASGLAGAAPALVLTTFLTYWTHRIQHRFDALWRLGHQLHHAAARVDIASAMMFHPIDLMVQVGATTLAASLLGVSLPAAALAGLANFAIALFQHWNVRTPQWLGFVVQRPEAHCLHHERDVHARNFADLPVWDMLFGTFANPKTADVAVGFEPQRSRRILAMIFCIDVNRGQARAKL